MEFLLLMHGDTATPESAQDWDAYIAKLNAAGALRGGSAIGSGVCFKRGGTPPGLTAHLTGYIKIVARDLSHVQELLIGNPVYEHGGTVEVRELPRTD